MILLAHLLRLEKNTNENWCIVCWRQSNQTKRMVLEWNSKYPNQISNLTNHDLEGKPCHPKFWEFMDFFGEKTDLTNFTGYLGDMGQRGHSYVDNWQVQTLMTWFMLASACRD